METILFNANFNYFFNFIEKAPVHNFADDNSISLFVETPEDLVKSLEQKNKVAIKWFPINNMNKNLDKCQALIIDKKQRPLN